MGPTGTVRHPDDSELELELELELSSELELELLGVDGTKTGLYDRL